jgi:glucan phosphoethanolaminetransferase (alkaline phosphatase superfamily)
VAKARRLFFTLLAVAIALAAAAASLSLGLSDVGSTRALARFVVCVLAVAAVAATWATAVAIASVHRVVWPLVMTTAMVVAGIGTTAAWWASGR